MAGLIFLLGFLLFFGSDSPAQVYKYTDGKGTIYLTDNPPPSPVKDVASDKEQKPREVKNQAKSSGTGVKDILEMGREVLAEELAKPPEKQDQRLIKEMTEILYGDVSGKKSGIKRPVAPQQSTENSIFTRTLRYIDNLISFRK